MAYEENEMDWEEEGDIDLSIVREALCDELEGLDRFQEHINAVDSEEALHVLEGILDSRKDSVARLTKLLGQLDAELAAKFRQHGVGQ